MRRTESSRTPRGEARGTNLPRVAEYNRVLVLDLVRRSPGISRRELVQRTGLTIQTMSNICRRLLQDGHIREAGRVSGGMGAPHIVYEVDPSGMHAIGIHLDPARLAVVLIDLLGDVVARRSIAGIDLSDPPAVLDLMVEMAREVVRESGVMESTVSGMGIALPGPLSPDHGTMVNPPYLPQWSAVRVRDELEGRWGAPVHVEKDSTAAAAGEIWRSPADRESLVFLYLGTGAAAGIVLDGELVHGSGANIGNIEHLVADPDGPECPCGGRGCVSVTVRPAALVGRAVTEGLLDEKIDSEDPGVVDAALADLARNDDPAAAGYLRHAAEGFAQVAVQLANLLDLDAVVLGGPQWPVLRESFSTVMAEMINARYIAPDVHGIDVRSSAVGSDVAAIGAASLAMRSSGLDALGKLHLE